MLKDLSLEFNDFQYAQTPLYQGELAKFVCVEEPLKYDHVKHKTYFLNENGQIVTSFEYEYGDVEQLSKYRQNIFVVSDDISKKQKVYIVKLENSGNHTVLGEYDSIEYGEENFTFAVRKDGKYGFINLDGELIIAPQYDDYVSFVGGVAQVKFNDTWGLVDKQNNILLPFIYSKKLLSGKYQEANNWKDENGNLQFVCVKKKDKFGILSPSGEEILPCEYDEIFNYIGENCFIVRKDNLYGLVDTTYNVLIPCIYDEIDSEENCKLCMVKKGDLYGLIDKKGNIVYLLGKERIESLPYDGVYKIYGYDENNRNERLKRGFVNELGKLIIPVKYYTDEHFVNGYCVVQNEQRESLIINKNNEIIFKNEYKEKYDNYTHCGKIKNLGYGLFLIEIEQGKYKLYKADEQ